MLSESDFQRALATTLQHEGSAYNPNDPGGGSKYGILQGTYTTWLQGQGLPSADIQDISLSDVANIYRDLYWVKSGAPGLPYPLAAVHFDTAVNMGVGEANKILSRSGGDVAAYVADRVDVYGQIADRQGQPQSVLDAWTQRAESFLRSDLGKAGGIGLLLLVVALGFAFRGRS